MNKINSTHYQPRLLGTPSTVISPSWSSYCDPTWLSSATGASQLFVVCKLLMNLSVKTTNMAALSCCQVWLVEATAVAMTTGWLLFVVIVETGSYRSILRAFLSLPALSRTDNTMLYTPLRVRVNPAIWPCV